MRIPSSELVGHKIELHEQIHVNHANCPAGVDTRKRLYIKRVGHNAYVGHCFNCGNSGYSFNTGPVGLEDLLGKRKSGVLTEKKSLYSSSSLTSDLPIHVQKYLLDYGIQVDEAVNELKYRYHEEKDLLVMPYLQYRKDSDPCGYQARFMGKGAAGARYTTYSRFGQSTSVIFRGVNKPIVLVEDQISAWRVFRDSGENINVGGLLGTSFKDWNWLKSVQDVGCKELIIWLDNDPAGITAAKNIYKEAKVMVPKMNVEVVKGVDQPKSLSVADLQDGLRQWTT